MRRCIGCKPDAWRMFNFDAYKSHSDGYGYATPGVCLSAAFAWLDIVKHEYQRWQQLRVQYFKLSKKWCGSEVMIVMHDGSTTTLGTMLRLYLPAADVKRYDKCASYSEHTLVSNEYFTIMCEDGIESGQSLCRMRQFVGRPIDLLLTIHGHDLGYVSEDVTEDYEFGIGDLASVQYKLESDSNVWDTLVDEGRVPC